jgi:DNA-directed RNA polymerase subunit RPC12/RpoP
MTERAPTATIEPTCPQCGAPVPLPDYADMAVCAYCGSTLAREQVRVLQEERQRRLERQPLRSVQCSQCAGPLSAWEGKRVLVCDHCGVRVAVLEQGGLSRWYFPARVDRNEAASTGATWLSDFHGVAAEFRDARLTEAKLVYAPIWEHKTLTAGWEFGSQQRTRVVAGRHPLTGETDETMRLEFLHEAVQEPRLQERRFYLPATDFEVLGAVRPRVTGRELLVPLLAGEVDAAALVLDEEGDATAVVERGRNAARLPITGAIDPQLHLFLFRERAAVLYYPLWLLRYRQGDVYCRVIVDGRDGTVNSAIAPADQRKSVAALVAKISALAIAAAVFVYFAVTVEPGRTPLAAVAVVALLAAVFLGIRFRPEKEVEYHDTFSG